MTPNKVLEALPGLSQAELRAVKLAVERLLDVKPSQLDEELFHAVLDVFGTKSIGVKAFMKTKAYPIFIENQRHVNELIDRIICDVPRSKIKVIHLKRFLVSLIIADLNRSKWDASMPHIAGHLANVEMVWESNFPGYLAAGLTHLVLKGLQNNTHVI